MSDKQSVDYQVGGIANGVPINVKGRGHIGPAGESGRQRLDIELYVEVVPLGFDPALLALGGFDLLFLLTARDRDLADPVLVHTDLTLLDEGHREMGVIRMASRIEVVASEIAVRGQFLEARTNLEALERMTSVERVTSAPAVPLGPDGVVVTNTAALGGSFGNAYLSVAVSRVCRLPENAVEAYTPRSSTLTIERACERERDHRVLVGVEYEARRIGSGPSPGT